MSKHYCTCTHRYGVPMCIFEVKNARRTGKEQKWKAQVMDRPGMPLNASCLVLVICEFFGEKVRIEEADTIT